VGGCTMQVSIRAAREKMWQEGCNAVIAELNAGQPLTSMAACLQC